MTKEIISHKHCTKCRRLKPLDLFYKSTLGRGGRRTECKECSSSAKFAAKAKGQSAVDIAGMKRRRERAREIKTAHKARPDIKWCQSGNHFQPRTKFSMCKRAASGLQTYCKDCRSNNKAQKREHYRTKAKEWRQHTVEERKRYGAAYYKANKERLSRGARQYRITHQDSISARGRKYYQEHKDAYLADSRARYHAKSEEICAKEKAKRRANPEAFKAKTKRLYWKNRDKMRVRAKAYYRRKRDKNPEAIRNQSREWTRKNPEKRRVISYNDRAKRKRASGAFTKDQLLAKYAFHGWRCYLCGTPVTFKLSHSDHRIPISRGGSNWIANIAPACANCNLTKNSKTAPEHYAVIGFSLLPSRSGLGIKSQSASLHSGRTR